MGLRERRKAPSSLSKTGAFSLTRRKTAPVLKNLGMWVLVLLPLGEGPLVGL